MVTTTTPTPAPVPAYLEDGMVKTIVAKTIADTSAPKVTELTGANVLLDLSLYLTADGFSMTHSQDSIDDDREGLAEIGTIPGQEKYTDTTLRVIDNTNRAGSGSTAVANEAVEKLTKGTSCFIVRRRGMPAAEPFAAGQTVTVLPVTIGIKTAVAHAANQRQLSQITYSVTPGAQDETAKVVAGS